MKLRTRTTRFETMPVAEVLKQVTEVNMNVPLRLKRANGHGAAEDPGSDAGKRIPTAPERRSVPGREEPGMKLRVLVVDDEHAIADTLKLILENRGYEVTVAYDGESALDKYDEVKPSLVLSDVVMPGIDGVEMAVRIRERGGCPILLLSGQAATSDLLERARSAGHDFELLTKPIHPTDLLERIALCIGVSGTKPRVN